MVAEQIQDAPCALRLAITKNLQRLTECLDAKIVVCCACVAGTVESIEEGRDVDELCAVFHEV